MASGDSRADKIARILARPEEAPEPGDKDLPGFRLHRLNDDLAGFRSVTVSGNRRAIFRFDGRHASDVDLIDYHQQERATPTENPPHPGPSVRDDCLEPLGLNVTEAAARLGISRRQLSDIVNGHAGISPAMAIRLDKAFGGGPARGCDRRLPMSASATIPCVESFGHTAL